MANKPKMEDVDPAQAAQMLGLSIPAGAEVSTQPVDEYDDGVPRGDATNVPQAPQQQVQQPVESGTQPQGQGQQSREEGEVGEMTWEQRAKLFQSNFTKEQARAKQLEDERQKIEDERNLFRQMAYQNRLIQQQMGQRPQEPTPAPEPQVKEPVIEDYVKDYDPDDPLDFRNPGVQRYLAAARKYDRDIAIQQATSQFQQQTEQEKRMNLTKTRAKRLAEKYIEFRDPFTGEPDYQKIQDWIDGSTGSDDLWVNLRTAQQHRPDEKKSSTHSPTQQDIVSQIEKTASIPSSVATATPAEGISPAELSESDKKMSKIFSDWKVFPQ